MKTYTEKEVENLLRRQIVKCADHLENETYCLRSPTPNYWDKKETINNLGSIVKKTPIINYESR